MSEEFLAKKEWGPGPWQSEPDRHEFRHLGLPCLVVRNTRGTGSWCGYVGIPKGHPYYKKPYSKIPLDVHGGLTYASECQGDICHIPREGESDHVWWIGFDCAHAGDLSPAMNAQMAIGRMLLKMPDAMRMPFPWERYRDMPYVIKEIKNLARQVKSVGKTSKRISNQSLSKTDSK